MKPEQNAKPGRLSFFLDVADAEHLKAEAKRLDTSVSELVRALLAVAGLDDLDAVHRGSPEGYDHPNFRHGRFRRKTVESVIEEVVFNSKTGKAIPIRLPYRVKKKTRSKKGSRDA